MRLDIYSQLEFDIALASGAFKTATDVQLFNLPLLTEAPAMPNATVVWLFNLPLVTKRPKIDPRGSIYRNGRVWK